MVYPEGTDVADLYNNLCEFFSEKKAKIIPSKDSYRAKIELYADDCSELEESMPTCDDLDSLGNLVADQDLKLCFEIKKYENNQFVVEFSKRCGDKFRFYQTYQEYLNRND